MSRKWTKEQKEELAAKLQKIQEYKVILRVKDAKQYDKIRKEETEYMLNHFKSLENPQIIIDCVFVCGRSSEINKDLCTGCELDYNKYIMNQKTGGENKMGDDESKPEEEKKQEDSKPEEEKKEDSEKAAEAKSEEKAAE